jgi:adenylate kinase family enzyme
MNTMDVKKLLGNPKITFVLGKDSAFREQVCQKLVEEYKYTVISTEKLAEIENQKSKKKINDGTMEINALIANPSKNYLMDGFPSTADQAINFEQNVCECQTVLYFEDQGLEGDDQKEEADPASAGIQEVIEKYKLFGKVRVINANQDFEQVYRDTQRALLPEVFCLIGPKASGKTTVGSELAERTNMTHMEFNEFIRSRSLQGADDETVTFELIKHLLDEVSPRILIENFPQNVVQAKCFIKNCTEPSKVFYCKCSKDTCQERMITLGKDHPSYVSSAILSKKIKKFHDESPTLIPYLQDNTPFHEINCDQDLEFVHQQVRDIVEPTIIHIRAGSNNDLKMEMVKKLVSEHGYTNLEVNSLIRLETERRTPVGQEFLQIVQHGKIIPADMIVRMLRKIIYSGQAQNKFILNGFPDVIEQVNEFEKNCAKISAVFLTSNEGENVVEIKNNNLTLFNIDALFQKEFRLKITDSWDYSRFNEMLGNKTDYIIVSGTWCSGKTHVCKYLEDSYGYTIVDHNVVLEECKKKHENDEEPPESIPTEEVIEELLAHIDNLKQTKSKFVFDTLPGTDPAHFDAILDHMGIPDYIMVLDSDLEVRKKRFLAKAEAEEWGEEHEEETKNLPNNTQALVDHTQRKFEGTSPDRFRILEFNLSAESMQKQLNDELSPKVILVSHDKRLASDTTCSNLAIKYNLIYISVYQLIRKHIEGNTEFGRQLLATKKPREIKINSQTKDEFQEAEYSAIHFDLPLVLKLIKTTINETLTNQKYILLEGLCNSNKLSKEEDLLELRPMDELIEIEREIGEVVAISSLKFTQEKENMDDEELEYEEFPEPPPEEEKKQEGEGEGGDEQPPPEEDEGEGDNKKEDFKVEDYQWTITNRKPKNMTQVFLQLKDKGSNVVHEVKNAEEYSSSQYESISKSLDEFITRVVQGDLKDKNSVVQIVFNE